MTASSARLPLTALPRIAGQAVRLARLDPAADAWPNTTRVLPWSLAAFVTMLWLVPFNAINLPIPLPLDAKLDRPLLAAVCALWLASIAVATGEWRPRLRLRPLHGAVAFFFCLAVASIVLNAGALAPLAELQLALKKLVLLGSYLLFFVVSASVIRRNEVPAFVRLLLWLAGITAITTVIEYRLETNLFYDWLAVVLPGMVSVPLDLHTIDPTGRTTVYGAMDHPLELALVLGLALPFALVKVLEASGRREQLKTILLTGLLLAGIFATQRKTGLMASGVAVVVLLAYRPGSIKQMLAVGVGLVLILHVLAPGAMGSLRQQLEPQRLTGVSSTQQRSDDYEAVSPDIRTHPVLGRGYGSYDGLKYRILDNEYLGLLVTMGVAGAGAYVLMLLTGMGTAHRLARNRTAPLSGTALAASAAVASFLVGGFLFDVLSFPHVTYMLCFVLALVVASTTPDRPGRLGA